MGVVERKRKLNSSPTLNYWMEGKKKNKKGMVMKRKDFLPCLVIELDWENKMKRLGLAMMCSDCTQLRKMVSPSLSRVKLKIVESWTKVVS